MSKIIPIDEEIKEKIKELGRIWKNSSSKPQIDEDIVSKWEKVINDWVKDKSLPLIIRKGFGPRGSEHLHDTGRVIIPADNSFSHWVYYNVLNGIVFSLDKIRTLLNEGKIPMSFAIKAAEKDKIKHKQILGKYSLNELGWKLCHFETVGLGKRTPANKIDIKELESHFLKLANPRNMFLLPLQIGDLGEIQEFIDEQR